MNSKLEYLKKILDESRYTVVLCGSGMVSEVGYKTFRDQNQAYEIEKKYGRSPEYIFTSNYYNTRTDKFFEFYKSEVLEKVMEPTETALALKKLEDVGKVHCIVTSNMFDLPGRAGCHNVLNLHGTIYENTCPKCGKKYPVEYIMNCKKVPYCEECNAVIRPGVSLFGEQLDSRLTSQAAGEVEKADVLLLLGTTLSSDVYSNYVRFFEGKQLVIVHTHKHYRDFKADLVIYDQPKNVLPRIAEEF